MWQGGEFPYGTFGFAPYGFAAALFAIPDRCALVIAAFRASPPLLAPSLLSATVAGSRESFSRGVPGGCGLPTLAAALRTKLAICVNCRRLLLARVGMA